MDSHSVDRQLSQLDAAHQPWIVLSNQVGTVTAQVDEELQKPLSVLSLL